MQIVNLQSLNIELLKIYYSLQNCKELGELLTGVACSLLSLCVYLKQPCANNCLPTLSPLKIRDQTTDTSSLSDVSSPPLQVVSKPHIYLS